MKVSVIICCYNSVGRINPTLEALANQKTSVHWEIILIDNNSSDNTSEVAQKKWNSLNSGVSFEIISEKTPGLSAARKKGIANASGELIVFCDDDNHLKYDYVEQASKIMDEDPEIGALCGYNEPLFESTPSQLITKNLNAFACGRLLKHSGYLTAKTVPWGAGLTVRSSFFKALLSNNFQSLLSDRKGEELSSGGDTEYCYLLKLCGFRWRYDTRLSLKHVIPSNRLNEDYLKRLYRGFGQANVVIDFYFKRGNRDTIKITLTWWKVYLMQKLYFFRHPIDRRNDNAQFEKEFRKGFLEKLWDERKLFASKQDSVRNIITKLPRVD